MTNTIDKRVVEMGFDNQQFESGVKTSVQSLNNLKKGLNLEASTRSLTGLANAGKNFTLSHIADGVDAISGKFSALGIMGMTVLMNLTNAAMNFGTQMVKAIAIEPITQGLKEYETQMGAIQTVLANTASKGTTLSDVNAALEELNRYADKTIYNFSEMTKNIGTFTAAGVDLKTSTSAIKGIANLAAVSGSNAQQASTAMYQLSQAMASGTVKLMDWNSVVNAGMGGEVFKNSLMETARVHKVAIDSFIKQDGSFRETLQRGWLTTEILTETLSKFTGDLSKEQLKSMGYTEAQAQEIIKLGEMANDSATKVKTLTQLVDTMKEALGSGWAQTWQIVIGNFEEAKALFTGISNTLGKLVSASADSRNKVLQEWKDMGGRSALIYGMSFAFEAVINVVKAFTEAISEIFPPVTAEQLWQISNNFRIFALELLKGTKNLDTFKRTIKGVAAIFDIVRMAVVAVFNGFARLIGLVPISGKSILDFTANLGDGIVKFRDWIKANDVFNAFIEKIAGYLGRASQAVMTFYKAASETFGKLKEWLSTIFGDVDTSGVTTFVDKLKERFGLLGSIVEVVGKAFKAIGSAIKTVAPLFFDIASVVGKTVASIGSKIVEALTKVNYNHLFDGLNTGLLAALVLAIKKFIEGGQGTFDGITGILDGVKGSLTAWQEQVKANTLLTIASALGILALALIGISMVDSTKLTAALAGVTTMFIELLGAMAVFEKIPRSGGMFDTLSLSLIAMSASILILSFAVSKLAKIKPAELQNGMMAVEGLIIGLVAFSAILSKNSGGLVRGGAGLLIFSAALAVLASVVEKLGKLDIGVLQKGVTAIGAILIELGLFMNSTTMTGSGIGKGAGLLLLAAAVNVLAIAVGKFGDMKIDKMQQGLEAIGAILIGLSLFTNSTGSADIIGTSIGLTILAASMLIFAEAITRMGNLSWDQIGKGLATIAATLSIITIAMGMMPKDMILTAAGLVIVAGSLVILSVAMDKMGKMTWDEIGRGLTVLATSLTILAVAMYAMNGAIVGAAAIVIVSGALLMLAPALKALGSMKIEEIGLALLTLAGVFTVIGLAALILTPVIPSLLGLAGAMALLGVASIAVGAGLLMFSAGLAALAVSGAAGAAALVVVVSTIVGMVPMLIQTIVGAIIQFASLIAEGAPIIFEAFTQILLGLLNVIIQVSPALFEAITVLLLGLINVIITVTPQFGAAMLVVITTLLTVLVTAIPQMVSAGYDILIGVLKGIRDHIADVVTAAIEIVTNFIDAVAKKIPDVIQSAVNLMVNFINGLADGIRNNQDVVEDAIGNLADAIIDGLVSGLGAGVKRVVEAAANLAGEAIEAIRNKVDSHSPSKVTMGIGNDIGEGLAIGLDQYGGAVQKSASNLGDVVIDGISGAIIAIKTPVEKDFEFNPVIKPVVDFEDAINGRKRLGVMFDESGYGFRALDSKRLADRANPMISINRAADSKLAGIADKNIPFANVTYTQNNYSPKALSQLEIYRQTRNQLRTLKGLVGNS